MNIWEEVYSKHKKGQRKPFDPQADQSEQNGQKKAVISEYLTEQPELVDSGSMEETYYQNSEPQPQPISRTVSKTVSSRPTEEAYSRNRKPEPVSQSAPEPEPVVNQTAPPPEPQAPTKPVKARFIPRIPGKLTIPYPALLSKVHYGLSDTWANIMLETKQNIQTLLVCGPAGKEGVTLISYHLAMLLSKEYSMKVLYVDTNLKHTAIPKIQNLPGVYSFVAGQKDLASLVVQTEYPGLYLLPSGSGTIAKNIGGNMLSREPIESLLQFCRTNFDMTIIDGQPVVSSPVMIEFARIVDLTLLVFRFGHSRHEVCKLAIDKLQKFGITSLGVLLNDRKFIVPQKLYKLLG